MAKLDPYQLQVMTKRLMQRKQVAPNVKPEQVIAAIESNLKDDMPISGILLGEYDTAILGKEKDLGYKSFVPKSTEDVLNEAIADTEAVAVPSPFRKLSVGEAVRGEGLEDAMEAWERSRAQEEFKRASGVGRDTPFSPQEQEKFNQWYGAKQDVWNREIVKQQKALAVHQLLRHDVDPSKLKELKGRNPEDIMGYLQSWDGGGKKPRPRETWHTGEVKWLGDMAMGGNKEASQMLDEYLGEMQDVVINRGKRGNWDPYSLMRQIEETPFKRYEIVKQALENEPKGFGAGLRAGYEYGQNIPKPGGHGQSYSKSVFVGANPDAYDYLDPVGRHIGFPLGRMGADVTGHGSLHYTWNWHPLEIAWRHGYDAAAQDDNFTKGMSPAERAGWGTAAGYAATMGVASGAGLVDWTNPGEGFRPKGYSAINPTEDDPSKPQSAIGDAMQRVLLGRRGRVLPWNDFIKERNDVTYDQYQKYRDWQYGKDESDVVNKATLGISRFTGQGLTGEPEGQLMGYSVTPTSVLTGALGVGTLKALNSIL